MRSSSHASSTKGQWCGHWFRRAIHVSMAAIPFLYYHYAKQTPWLLLGALLLVALLEFFRLRFKFVFFGQREYEQRKISAFAWGMAGIILVLGFSPAPAYSIAIIVSCALGDPLIGELRRFTTKKWLINLIGCLCVMLVWLVCALAFGLSPWLVLFLPILTVFAEQIDLPWIDDNALMLLLPLLAILLVI